MKKYYSLLVTALVIFFTIRLVGANSDYFSDVENAYKDGTSVNLSSSVKAEDIEKVLLTHAYLRDGQDAKLVARTIADSLHKGKTLTSIYDLRKRQWQVPIAVVKNEGGVNLKARMAASYRSLGQLDTTLTEFLAGNKAFGDNSSSHDFKAGSGRIAVNVNQEGKSVAGVPVRLSHHFIDTTGVAVSEVLFYATTDSKGQVVFSGLDTSKSYSVLPVKEGFEYGSTRGTAGGSLGRTDREAHGLKKVLSKFSHHYGDLSFSFEQKEQRVRLLDDGTLRRIREDHSMTLRTPSAWKGLVTRSICWFVVAWLLLWGVMWVRRRGDAPYGAAAAIMGLTGLCLLGMFSFNDPLEDTLYGSDMLQGILVGVALMIALQFFNVRKFFQDGYKVKFDPLLTKRGLKGWGWLAAAMLLTMLLFTPLAHSVGGMSVNLVLGPLKFQPSEIAKYLIIVFMAAWFVRNIDTIVSYSEEGNAGLFWHKCRYMIALLAGMLMLMLLYMLLGDMGPGMVLVFTFILMYSIVKSKVALTADGGIDWGGVLKSDIVMLLAGVGSFLLMLWIGGKIGAMGIFAGVWLAGWLLFWFFYKRQIRETAIMANAIIAVFVFAKDLFRGTGVGDRLAMRSEMCSNTWGELGLTGADMAATSNSQVAEGLWGLASGGLFGQGLGHGSPNWIPAFHTDMVLESIGEQMGWIGLLAVVGLLWWLLHRTLAIGFRSRNGFTFYLCVGVAIVTAVQFIIIALGSTGVIPLTGVAVPFLSYGKVSMILNLLAFGLVLSVATFSPKGDQKSPAEEAERRKMKSYDAPVMVTRVAFVGVSAFLLCVFAWFTTLTRDEILVKPLYVIASNGDAVIQYNPRIAELTRTLKAGNIYDRRGLLLATSDTSLVKSADYVNCGVSAEEVQNVRLLHTRRYYPLGDRLLFMVGDNNSTLNLSYNEYNPIGYVAENQHMTRLRGFDNVLYEDEAHTRPRRVTLSSDKYYADRYLPPTAYMKNNVVVRDYSVLLPLLKAGIGSRTVAKVNERTSSIIKPEDIHMTLDAQLQCRLQQELQNYVNDPSKGLINKNLLRISVVVLDASQGDMLASALYPQPNQDTMWTHAKNDTYKYYRDASFGKGQKAYTDRDLGLTYQTAPGSTAKVMSAIAGLRAKGYEAANKTFDISNEEAIEKNKSGAAIEPIGQAVTMKDALVYSSNCYFINLVNHYNLYSELDSVYSYTGVRIDGKVNDKTRMLTPYFFRRRPMSADMLSAWHTVISSNGTDGVNRYNWYMERRKKQDKNGKYLYQKMNYGPWQWAWGQGTLSASPLNMARVISAIANGGIMQETRFLLDETSNGVKMMEGEYATLLKGYLREMAEHANSHAAAPANAIHDKNVGGKTGTPERVLTKNKKPNDGWFIFYVDDCNVPDKEGNHKASLAIAVRMERLNDGGSGIAMRVSRDLVLRVLGELGYR